jgi:hypothetical protein
MSNIDLQKLPLSICHGIALSIGVIFVGAAINVGLFSPLGVFNLPLGADFYCFWSAGRMALEGRAHDIYDPAVLATFQQNYSGAPGVSVPWFYPPLLLLYVACLFAMLPYKLAYLAYLALSLFAYTLLAPRFFKVAQPLFLVSLPALWLNLLMGQNGLLTAVIILGGLHLLERRESMAGAVFALLSYKPQFCFAVPAYLIVQARRPAIVSGIMTLAVLLAITTLIWGGSIWSAFFEGLTVAQSYNQTGNRIRPETMASLYGALKVMGFDHRTAQICNYGFAAIAGCAAVRIWLLPVEKQIKDSVLILTTFLVAPHVMYYDFVVIGAVVFWLWPNRTMRPALAILWAAPYLYAHFGSSGIPFFTVASAWIFAVLLAQASGAAEVGIEKEATCAAQS